MFKPFVSLWVGLAVLLTAQCAFAGGVSVNTRDAKADGDERRALLPKAGRSIRMLLRARDLADPDAARGVPMPHGEVDLAETFICSDGLAFEVAVAGPSTATIGEPYIVRGSLRLDPEAKFTASSIVIYIARYRLDGTRVIANSGIGKPKLVAGQDNLYQFEQEIKTPSRPGSYDIYARFRGKTAFSKGVVNVSN